MCVQAPFKQFKLFAVGPITITLDDVFIGKTLLSFFNNVIDSAAERYAFCIWSFDAKEG